jgi:aspartyl/asparaginyl-tRNA synthetase
MRLNDDGKTVAAMDVLVPKVGELVGGSQREDRCVRVCAGKRAAFTQPTTACVGKGSPTQ